jgi:hypothetical protein
MVNEVEIKTYIERNDFKALTRVADGLMFWHQLTVSEVFRLFERLGGDREMLEREFLGYGVD